MKKNKNYPSKGFWTLYIICLFILIYIGFKNGVKTDLLYIILTPIANLIITGIIIVLYFVIGMILGDRHDIK